jgi:hypothetical protein
MNVVLAHVPDERERSPASRVGQPRIDDAQAQASGAVELRRERELHRAPPRDGIPAIAGQFDAERRRTGADEAQSPVDGVELRSPELEIPARALAVEHVRRRGGGGQLRIERLTDRLEGYPQRNFKLSAQRAGGGQDEAAEQQQAHEGHALNYEPIRMNLLSVPGDLPEPFW